MSFSSIPRVSPPHESVAESSNNNKKRKFSGDNVEDEEEEEGTGSALNNSISTANKRASGAPGIEKVVRELLHSKLTSDDVERIGSALQILADLCKGEHCERNRRVIGDLGGCQTVLFVMRRAMRQAVRSAQSGIVIQAIRFLANWVCKESENCDTLRRLKGIHAVADAMNAFPAVEYLQRVGCAALLNFSAECGGPTAMMSMIGADAFSTLIRAMRAHPGDAHLQRFGCILLSKVVEGITVASSSATTLRGLVIKNDAMVQISPSSIRNHLFEAGALGAVSSAYEKHARNCPAIRAFGARAIQTLIVIDSLHSA
jgi:hypothetical protein